MLAQMLYPEESLEALAVQAAKRNGIEGCRAWQQREPVVFEPPVRQRLQPHVKRRAFRLAYQRDACGAVFFVDGSDGCGDGCSREFERRRL